MSHTEKIQSILQELQGLALSTDYITNRINYLTEELRQLQESEQPTASAADSTSMEAAIEKVFLTSEGQRHLYNFAERFTADYISNLDAEDVARLEVDTEDYDGRAVMQVELALKRDFTEIIEENLNQCIRDISTDPDMFNNTFGFIPPKEEE